MRNFYQEFKTPIVTIALIFLGFLLYTKIFGPIPFSVNSITTTKTDLFSADGLGEQIGVPDSADVFVGVTQVSTTVADAQNKANSTVDKIINEVRALGISEKDIKTTNYSVSPDYGSNPRIQSLERGTQEGSAQNLIYPVPPVDGGGQQIVGYTVSQNVEVKVKPIDKVNKVIDVATKNGANLVGGVNFTFSDDLQKSLEQKARVIAVKNAKEKAQSLANISGIRLGRVVNVIESSNGFPRPYALSAMEVKTDQSQPTNVTPGQNTVSITVTIYYETY